jgi:hypothetical protein
MDRTNELTKKEYLQSLYQQANELELNEFLDMVDYVLVSKNSIEYEEGLIDLFEPQDIMDYIDSENIINRAKDILNGTVLDENEIVEQISFDNCNKIAYLLAMDDIETANGLYEELKYWKEKGRI